MKILFVLDKPNLYGSELHVKKLIEGLNGEFSIRLLTFQRGPLLDLMSVENIVFSLSWLDVFSLIKWKQLKISMLEEKVDLIHAHQPKAIFFMSLMGWFLNIKTIITIHSLPITNSQSHKNKVVSLAVYLGHQLIKLTSEFFANKVIYLSDFSFKTAFSKQKSMIIPNWINHNFAGIPNKVISSDSRIKFLTVGSISFNKGFDRLLNVLEKYENSNWELHVVGEIDPLFRDNFNRILNDIRFKDQIVFHGYLNNVKDLYESCDIFILLSRAETFGLVYIEAMSFGLPIIAWDIPVIHEIIPKSNLILKNFEGINELGSFIKSGQINGQRTINYEKVKCFYTSEIILPIYKQLYKAI